MPQYRSRYFNAGVNRARNNVLNVPDHGDRQSRLFSDQIKIWPIRSIVCLRLSFLEKNSKYDKLYFKFKFKSTTFLDLLYIILIV